MIHLLLLLQIVTSVKTPAPMTVIKMLSVKTMWDHLNVLVREGSQEMEKHAKTSMNVKMPPCTTAPFLLLESRVSIHLENSSARASQAILGMESRVM